MHEIRNTNSNNINPVENLIRWLSSSSSSASQSRGKLSRMRSNRLFVPAYGARAMYICVCSRTHIHQHISAVRACRQHALMAGLCCKYLDGHFRPQVHWNSIQAVTPDPPVTESARQCVCSCVYAQLGAHTLEEHNCVVNQTAERFYQKVACPKQFYGPSRGFFICLLEFYAARICVTNCITSKI